MGSRASAATTANQAPPKAPNTTDDRNGVRNRRAPNWAACPQWEGSNVAPPDPLGLLAIEIVRMVGGVWIAAWTD